MQLETYTSYDFAVRFSNLTSPSGDQISLSPFQTKLPPLMIGMAVAYGVLFACGATANLWTSVVIGCVLREKSNDAPRNVQIYIFALCCSDLVILTSLTLLMSDLLTGRWSIGSTTLCHLYLFSECLNKFFGPFILTAMSGTCCQSVCLPRRSPGSSQTDTVVACLVVVCCVVFVIALSMPMFIYGDVYYLVIHNTSHYYYLPKCAFQPSEEVLYAFNIYTFVLGYAVPAALFTFFYGALVCYVGLRSRSVLLENSNSYSWKVAKTASGLVLFYLSCWTPYWVIMLYNFFNPLHDTSGTNAVTYLSYAVHLLPYINCAGYPILYTLLNRKIKRAYQRAKLRRRHHSKSRGLNHNCCTGALGNSSYFGNTNLGSTVSQNYSNVLTTCNNSQSVILCNDGQSPKYRTTTTVYGTADNNDYATDREEVEKIQRKNRKKISAPGRLATDYVFKKSLWT